MITQIELKLTFACGNSLNIVTSERSTSDGVRPAATITCSKCKQFTVDFNPEDEWRLASKKAEMYALHGEVCGQ